MTRASQHNKNDRPLTDEELLRISNVQDELAVFLKNVRIRRNVGPYIGEHAISLVNIFAKVFDDSLKFAGRPQTTVQLNTCIRMGRREVRDVLKQQLSITDESLLGGLQGLYYRFVDQFMRSINSPTQSPTP